MDSLYGDYAIKRTIFFAGKAIDSHIVSKIVHEAGISAQIGDPFGALTVSSQNSEAVKVEKYRSSWSVAFGLSLTAKTT